MCQCGTLAKITKRLLLVLGGNDKSCLCYSKTNAQNKRNETQWICDFCSLNGPSQALAGFVLCMVLLASHWVKLLSSSHSHSRAGFGFLSSTQPLPSPKLVSTLRVPHTFPPRCCALPGRPGSRVCHRTQAVGDCPPCFGETTKTTCSLLHFSK